MEQYEIDKEGIKELQESYKIVERVLDEKEEKRKEGRATLFFVKWTSESRCNQNPEPIGDILRRPSI